MGFVRCAAWVWFGLVGVFGVNKYTPGPWHYVMRNVNELMQTFHGVRAGSFYFDIPTSNDVADARLIAAAPELLEALEDSLTALNIVYPNGSPVLNAARAAIAKARGEA